MAKFHGLSISQSKVIGHYLKSPFNVPIFFTRNPYNFGKNDLNVEAKLIIVETWNFEHGLISKRPFKNIQTYDVITWWRHVMTSPNFIDFCRFWRVVVDKFKNFWKNVCQTSFILHYLSCQKIKIVLKKLFSNYFYKSFKI